MKCCRFELIHYCMSDAGFFIVDIRIKFVKPALSWAFNTTLLAPKEFRASPRVDFPVKYLHITSTAEIDSLIEFLY
jgi:hypothetical protein